MQMPPATGYWWIVCKGTKYRLEVLPSKQPTTLCVLISGPHGPYKITQYVQLKRTLDMWFDSSVDMPPGEFVTKTTGLVCKDT